MAMKEVRLCDVFGLKEDVHRYVLTLRRAVSNPAAENPAKFNVLVDLSGRAVKRAVKLLERATTPPVKREQQDET